MKNRNVDLINGNIDSSLREYALPLALSFIIHMVYSWVDLFFVSRLGSSAVAALGISERIWFFTFAIGSGFAIGTSIIVARRVGEGNFDKAGETSVQGLIYMFIFGVLLAILLFVNLDPILNLLGIRGEVKVLSKRYFEALFWGIPFNFLIFQINALIRASGNTFYPMLILITANVLNFIFTPLLVFGIGPFPRLEIYGAGIGTSIAQIFGSIIAFAILHYKFERIELKLKYFRLRFDIFRRITKLGMPASLQLIAVSITSMGLAANANIFGTEILSTYIIGLKIDLFVSMVIFAMGASLEVITGQNIGAGKPERVYLYHISAIKQLTVLLGTLGVLVFFFGKYVGYIFVNDEFIISELDKYLKFAAFSYIPFSIGIASIRVISGAGDYFRSLVIVTIALICVQLPSAYIISNLTNNQMGIWFSMVMAIIFFAIIGFREVKRGKWLGKNV